MDKDIKIISQLLNNNNFSGFEFNSHLDAIDMKEKIDSWCIQLNEDNEKEIRNWFDNKVQDYSIGNYYGIHKINGHKTGHMYHANYRDYYDKQLTTEEFYQKIGLIKENKELEIEIW